MRIPAALYRFSDVTGRLVWAWVAQLAERVLGKDEVTGSIPVPGSSIRRTEAGVPDGGALRRAGVTQG